MVKIDARYDEALELTVFDVSGRVRAEDLMGAVETHYGSRPTSNSIWDLTLCDLSNIDMNALIRISDTAKKFSAKRKNPRTIIVVAHEQEAYLVKLYGEIGEMRGSPIHYVLVYSLDKAYQELAIEDPFAKRSSAAS